MDEMNKLPEEQNNEEIKDQGASSPETVKASEPIANIPAPKLPIPKLPLIIGGAVAGAAAIAVTVGVVLGGGGHKHSYGEWQTVDAPTCLAAGIEERVCECDERETRPIDALGHTEVVNSAVAPTCISTGLTEGKHCSECGAVITPQDTVPMIDHTYANKYDEDCNTCGHIREAECAHIETEVIPGKAATCSATGLTDGEKCKKCGDIVVAQTSIPTIAHTETSLPAREATCSATGLTEGTKCSVCSKTLVAQREIPKIAHTYDDKYDESCNKCGFTRDAECAHIETTIINGYAATCTATGLTDGMNCKKCGEILVEQTVISVKPHTEAIDAAKEATCTATGLTEGKHCSVCSKVLVEQTVVSLKPHTEVIDSAVAATCTKTGLTEGKHCSVCSKVLVAQQTTSKIDHTESNWIIDKPATKNENGLRHTECTVCGEKINEETIQPTGSIGLSYLVNLDNISCSITGIGTCTDSKIVIPATIDGYRVVSIAQNAFSGCNSITEIAIPQSLKNIGNYAFYNCLSLTSITIPRCEGLNIEHYAFKNCSLLNNVYFEGNIEDWCKSFRWDNSGSPLENGANLYFNGELVTTIEIPKSINTIPAYAFTGCTSLTSIKVPKSVRYIEWSAFSNSSLKEVFYEGDAKDWCNINIHPFATNYDLYFDGKLVNSLDITTNIPDYAFYGCTSLTNVTTSGSATTIGQSAFEGCSSLAIVVIGDCTTTIGDEAFQNCYSLASVTVGSKVKYINSKAFYGCYSLYEICDKSSTMNFYAGKAYDGYIAYYAQKIQTGNAVSSVRQVGDYVIYDDGANVLLLKYIGKDTEFTLPETIDGLKYTIQNYAFCNNNTITALTIPERFNGVGEGAFRGMESLQTVSIPSTLTSIPNYMFANCRLLKDVVLSSNLRTIGDYAFKSCYSIYDIVIPEKVTTIGKSAFRSCCSLTRLTLGNRVNSIGEEAFLGCDSLVEVCNKSSLNISKGSYNNGYVGRYAKHLIFDESDTYLSRIGDYIIYNDGVDVYLIKYIGTDTKLILPQKIGNFAYKIYRHAFDENNTITSLIIPGWLGKIDSYTFANMKALNNITILSGVTDIGLEAFGFCSSLKTIVLSDTVSEISSIAFNGCTSICFNMYGGLNYLGTNNNPYYYVYEFDGYQDCIVHSNTVVIGANALEYSNIYYEGTLTDWLKIHFVGAVFSTENRTEQLYINGELVTNLVIPDGVKHIPSASFYGYDLLSSIVIPSSVESIGSSAFEVCYGLKSVTLCNGIKTIDSNAFAGCDSLEIVVIPDSVISIGRNSFYSCDYLKHVTLGKGIESIGEQAFAFDDMIISVNYTGTLEQWLMIEFGDFAANPLKSLARFYINNEIVTNLVIPDSISEIKPNAFYACLSLTSVILHENVTSIGEHAFAGCYNLVEICNKSSLNITKSSNEHGYIAYYAWRVITDESQTAINKIGDFLIYDYGSDVYLVQYVANASEITLPEYTKNYKIKDKAFYRDDRIGSVIISNSVTCIGQYAFAYANNLTNITLGNKLLYIGANAFESCPLEYNEYDNCQYLGTKDNPYYAFMKDNYTATECYLHSNTKIVVDRAFLDNTKLKIIEIPSGVLCFGDSAFNGCRNLNVVYFEGTLEDWLKIIFESYDSTPMYYAYNIYFEGVDVGDTLVIPDGITHINANAFYKFGLSSYTIPSSVTFIGDSAFWACSKTNVHYNGTMAEWEAIHKSSIWGPYDSYSGYTVFCTDGKISK